MQDTENKEKKYIESLKEAISQGKDIMRSSFEKAHGIDHASSVAKLSVGIFQSLPNKYLEKYPDTPIELVELVAYWHDCYKAKKKEHEFKDIFIEGEESAKITSQMLKNKLTDEHLERVLDAIKSHTKPYLYFFRVNNIDPLKRVLLEADGIDGIRRERYMNGLKNAKTLGRKFGIKFFYYGFLFFYAIFPKTAYGRKAYLENAFPKGLFKKKI